MRSGIFNHTYQLHTIRHHTHNFLYKTNAGGGAAGARAEAAKTKKKKKKKKK
jgi:hypothetical protein